MAISITPISPVAISIFGFDIRWYALAYIIGFILCFGLMAILSRRGDAEIKLTKPQFDDLMTWAILCIIIGGRLGYVLFYNLPFFIENPLEILAVWHGGMSFHGGMLGAIAAIFLFAHRARLGGMKILDLAAVVAPIGLFFGRIANFINIEVMGRISDVPWAVTFNGLTEIPRHPSPLYEAFGEGVVLFTIMILLYTKTDLKRRPGALSGMFGILYGVIRIICEFFRAPDAQIGFLTSWKLTMGQLLSALMIVAGAWIFAASVKKR